MAAISADDSVARAITRAIQGGDVDALERLLEEDNTLATATIVDAGACERSLLHIATEHWA